MYNLAVVLPIERGSKIETPKTRVRSGTLPSGITTKMDLFAQHVAEGLSLANAYRAAFSTAKMRAKTIRDDASRLARHPGVRAAIEGYRTEIDTRNRMSALERSDLIWQRLWAVVEGADVPPAVKVKGLELAARLAGMFKAPQDHQPVSAAAMEVELRAKLQELWQPHL